MAQIVRCFGRQTLPYRQPVGVGGQRGCQVATLAMGVARAKSGHRQVALPLAIVRFPRRQRAGDLRGRRVRGEGRRRIRWRKRSCPTLAQATRRSRWIAGVAGLGPGQGLEHVESRRMYHCGLRHFALCQHDVGQRTSRDGEIAAPLLLTRLEPGHGAQHLGGTVIGAACFDQFALVALDIARAQHRDGGAALPAGLGGLLLHAATELLAGRLIGALGGGWAALAQMGIADLHPAPAQHMPFGRCLGALPAQGRLDIGELGRGAPRQGRIGGELLLQRQGVGQCEYAGGEVLLVRIR